MTSREQFEAWVSGQYPCEPMEDILLKVGPEKERYHLKLIQRLWEAWQASREALEVVLPRAINTEEIGRAISKERTMTRLSLAGIKVKGE